MPLPGRASGSILSPPVGWGGPRDCQLDLGFLTFIPEAGSPRAEFSQAPVYPPHRRGGGSGCDPRLRLFPEQPKKARRDAHNSNKNNNSLNVFKSTGPALRPLVRSLVSSSAWRRPTGREAAPLRLCRLVILRQHLQLGDPGWQGRGQQPGVLRGHLGRGPLPGGINPVILHIFLFF